MFAFLAAIIPIAGSLYAATSYLLEQASLAHEHRARHRIANLVAQRRAAVRDGVMGVRSSRLNFENEEADHLASILLRANGLPHRHGSYTDIAIRSAMTGSLEAGSERRRQWVLLLSSMAGLVLLAVDAM